MITLLDDYAVHQTPEPVSRPATSDRNFYDRWFFEGHAEDGSLVFEAALGLYPHRQVMDAHVVVLSGGVQHCFHASRRAPLERCETQVGPFVLGVEQPMRRLRLQLDDAASGLACDLHFIARTAPGEEPRSLLHDGDRLVMHTTRFTQFGRWEGWLSIDGRRIAVTGALGVRDKSWGIRPVGEPEAGAPARHARAPSVYWAWAPLNFADRCTQFNTFEDVAGRPTQRAACVQPAYDEPEAIPPSPDQGEQALAEPRLAVRWRSGTRHPEGATLALQGPGGEPWRIELTPLATLLTQGLGYHHPTWGHGLWKGELVLGHERLRIDEIDPLRPENIHVHQLVSARLTTPQGEQWGTGLLETLCFGPHAPSGFTGFLDGAA